MIHDDDEFDILCMGSLAVLPSYQGNGIGTLLMNASIETAKILGYRGIVIFGKPNYYHRFGFENAKTYNIQTAWGTNLEEFMVLELYEGSLTGIHRKFYADPVFSVDQEELANFEKQFSNL
ncbi:N-acetyltransferase [Bacillus sp. WMMC1349]|uniref:GNAT family N-acetyltransferase n=1 Tax=Bacillus sp. WMMC1349 TaxID=2736254 RepID=UPI002815FAF2|nr:N-acetyltransferase [Bacillus sp. WMMC1349]